MVGVCSNSSCRFGMPSPDQPVRPQFRAGRQTSDAVVVIFRAAMFGALNEESMRCLLKKSGEFARWDATSSKTPEDEDVLYPPLAISTDSLRSLARSAERNDSWIA